MHVRETVMLHARQRIQEGNQARQEELERLLPRIPVSQIGHCTRPHPNGKPPASDQEAGGDEREERVKGFEPLAFSLGS